MLGWANYYRAVNPMVTFKKLDKFVWQRLQKWLREKYRLRSRAMCEQFQHRKSGPRGGTWEFAALDESTGKLVWRYKAVETKLVYYRPSAKNSWPNPYLEKVKVEHYELPNLKSQWNGSSESAEYKASRREVLGRAKGCCERCGKSAELVVHHKHRVGGRGKLRQAEHRTQMLEAVCRECHLAEHRAERIYRAKLMGKANRKKPKG